MFERKPISKQRYRSALGIAADILQAMMYSGTEGMFISAISRNANLSHSAATESCQKLVDADLIKSIRNERNKIFIITQKGIDFFVELQKFQDLARQMNFDIERNRFQKT